MMETKHYDGDQKERKCKQTNKLEKEIYSWAT